MRLTCPNCDAQYEVPDDVMPATGRDVQCSNCGQTWFEYHPDHLPAEDPDGLLLPQDRADPDEEISGGSLGDVGQTKPRQLDPAVADILREEAEAEYAARKREAPNAFETQQELGLDSTDENRGQQLDEKEQRALEAQRRMAQMRGNPDPARIAAMADGPRRALLPDIEEINSSLRSESDRSLSGADILSAMGTPVPDPRKKGFRRGFMMVMLLVLMLALLYVFAPQIARIIPGVDPYLSSYVAWVDGLRAGLNSRLQALLMWLDSLASETQGEGGG